MESKTRKKGESRMGVHDGHRQRLIARFLEEGLDSFEEHNVLELLLFYSIPRRDTNELAHRLIDAFGSLAGVLEAPYSELLQIEGVGENTAALIKLMPEMARAYLSREREEICLDSTEKAGRYLLPRFIGRREETVFLVCVDAKCRVLSCGMLHRGSVNASEVNLRKIIAAALNYDAAGVILAHNHPGGVALPSPEDLDTTRRVRSVLEAMGVQLMDHIIVADGDYVSLADSGQLG